MLPMQLQQQQLHYYYYYYYCGITRYQIYSKPAYLSKKLRNIIFKH